jgi:plasmid maintenance system killer protein
VECARVRHWRVVFRFEHAEVVDVDLIDYH